MMGRVQEGGGGKKGKERSKKKRRRQGRKELCACAKSRVRPGGGKGAEDLCAKIKRGKAGLA